MVKTKSVLLAVAGAIAVSGCVTPLDTRPISFDESKPTPPDKIFLYQAPEGNATIPVTFKRDAGASLCTDDLSINGKLAVAIDTKEKVTLYLPPGHVIFSVTPTCGVGIMVYEIESNITPESGNKFRITRLGGFNIAIMPTATN